MESKAVTVVERGLGHDRTRAPRTYIEDGAGRVETAAAECGRRELGARSWELGAGSWERGVCHGVAGIAGVAGGGRQHISRAGRPARTAVRIGRGGGAASRGGQRRQRQAGAGVVAWVVARMKDHQGPRRARRAPCRSSRLPLRGMRLPRAGTTTRRRHDSTQPRPRPCSRLPAHAVRVSPAPCATTMDAALEGCWMRCGWRAWTAHGRRPRSSPTVCRTRRMVASIGRHRSATAFVRPVLFCSVSTR